MACLAQMSFWQGLLGFAIVIMAGLLILVILLQRGRGEGLTGAFGGSGGSSAFGAKTGDVFTWITVVLAGAGGALAVVSNYVFDESPKAAVAVAAAPEPIPDGGAPSDVVLPPTTPAVVPAETGESAGAADESGAANDAPAGTPGGDAPAEQKAVAPGEGEAAAPSEGDADGGTEDPSSP